MTTSREVNWFFRILMCLSPQSPVYWLGSLVIINSCMQSQRFFLENDTLWRSGLRGIRQKRCKFDLFQFFQKEREQFAIFAFALANACQNFATASPVRM